MVNKNKKKNGNIFNIFTNQKNILLLLCFVLLCYIYIQHKQNITLVENSNLRQPINEINQQDINKINDLKNEINELKTYQNEIINSIDKVKNNNNNNININQNTIENNKIDINTNTINNNNNNNINNNNNEYKININNNNDFIAELAFQSQATNGFLTTNTNGWLTQNADNNTPLNEKTFQIYQLENDLVLIKSIYEDAMVCMESANSELAWVIRAVPENEKTDETCWWKLNEDGRIWNHGNDAYLNVITGKGGNAIRGHGKHPNNKRAAGPEPDTTVWKYYKISAEQLAQDKVEKENKINIELKSEEDYLNAIQNFPASNEKRVISFSLYGSNPKYTTGALKNIELQKKWYPGWICRFYVQKDVPKDIVDKIIEAGAEVIPITSDLNKLGPMFWRFLVAEDPDVDRYIIRDSDSRLNPRERFAVQEWIESGKSIHSIRDHVNHCRPLNGGLWGGVKGAIPDMKKLAGAWKNNKGYNKDQFFLGEIIWPRIKNDYISHDAYCCIKFPNAHPFPTKRPDNYQHVGQVFDEKDNPRMNDIDGFIRGKKIPEKCRKKPDWIYG